MTSMRARFLAIASSLLLLGSCADPFGPVPEVELQKSLALWAHAGIGNYQFEMRRSCYCGLAAVGYRLRVTVLNGTVVAAHNLDLNEALSPAEQATIPAIQGLFAMIRDAIDRSADRVRVRYDLDTGAPISIFIDWDLRAIDDELSVSVYSVEAAPSASREVRP